jgi:hypothetical protein
VPLEMTEGNRAPVYKGLGAMNLCDLSKVGQTWSVSPSLDMLPFGVTIPATVPQGSEIPEGLMNNPVYDQRSEQTTFRPVIAV